MKFSLKTNKRKQNISLFAFAISICILLLSSNDKKSKNIGALRFDSIQVNIDKPECHIVIDFTYPIQSSDDMLKDSLTNYFITACFGDKYIGEKPENVVKQFTDNYIQAYRHDFEPMFAEIESSDEDEEFRDEFSGWFSFYKSIEGHVQLYEGELLVYRIDSDEYAGGAHNSYYSQFLNIDLTLMRPLCLNDLFVGNYKDALSNLIVEQLMKDNKVTDREVLMGLGYGSGDITPTENFYLDKGGINFYYNPYEIACYATGTTNVTIPFKEIEHLIGNSPIMRNLR